ncbi:MAG: hypothetical protein ACD_64C00103G0002 [uncultured bacterium]|nr:MAG: hypothetical protein ACD_64C00103G0002 [uncultured bacterium]
MPRIALLTLCLISTIQAQEFIELVPLQQLQTALKNRDSLEIITPLITKETATTAALSIALKSGRRDIVRLLLLNKVKPNKDTLLQCAYYCQNCTTSDRSEWWLLRLWMHSVREKSFFEKLWELID